MKYLLVLTLFLQTLLFSQELKIKADEFRGDQKKGISVFTGHVRIKKVNDELNASKVTVYTDKNNKPTKFVAVGNASFVIKTVEGANYRGVAQKVVYLPLKKEYHFFGNVHLQQLNDKKEIFGDEVILQAISGKAYAKGVAKEPVIMIFDIKDEKEKK
ncbi:lipopolysaccharide transport periplasmic protein LptA [Sulfurimonas sp. NW15]|uniref:lipopolysaccharide transport periplasmic protein LptA n=1 Tax=Sulfurimonas sp. NW15 TaxID=2922729 RepID=UPI003DAA1CCF